MRRRYHGDIDVRADGSLAAPRHASAEVIDSAGRALSVRLARGESLPRLTGVPYIFGRLESGICQISLLAPKCRRFVADFLFPTQVTCLADSLQGTELRVFVEAIEDCQLLIWRAAPPIGPDASGCVSEQEQASLALARVNQRFVSLLTKTAGERYVDLDNEFPPEWHQIPQHLIASYLGVTPQYLCKLKRAGAVSEMKTIIPL